MPILTNTGRRDVSFTDTESPTTKASRRVDIQNPGRPIEQGMCLIPVQIRCSTVTRHPHQSPQTSQPGLPKYRRPRLALPRGLQDYRPPGLALRQPRPRCVDQIFIDNHLTIPQGSKTGPKSQTVPKPAEVCLLASSRTT